MIKLDPSWGEPNGSWKSFAYKMVNDSQFRGDIFAIFALFGIILFPILYIYPGLLR